MVTKKLLALFSQKSAICGTIFTNDNFKSCMTGKLVAHKYNSLRSCVYEDMVCSSSDMMNYY